MCAVAHVPSVVHIRPIIAHLPSGGHIAEVGVGGGGDDLEREVELDIIAHGALQVILARYVMADAFLPQSISSNILPIDFTQ